MEEERRERVLRALRRIRCSAASTEEELHAQVASAFLADGMEATHEVRLGSGCRIDFLYEEIGIEIKKSRPNPASLRAQLTRYAACDRVTELIVVAPRGVNLPDCICGKRVTMLALERLWGISLP